MRDWRLASESLFDLARISSAIRVPLVAFSRFLFSAMIVLVKLPCVADVCICVTPEYSHIARKKTKITDKQLSGSESWTGSPLLRRILDFPGQPTFPRVQSS